MTDITVPGTVWATGNHTFAQQLRDRYVGATRSDAARLSPEIARRVIETYTRPGDTVLDPDVGAGIVLCEALRGRRHAIGIHRDNRNQSVCEANLELAQLAVPRATAALLTDIDDPRAAGLPGAVDLVLTGLHRADTGGRLANLTRTYEMLDAVADWIWPGGRIAIVCRSERDRHTLVDGPGQIIEAAQSMGLRLVDHCIALTGALVGNSHVRPRASRREIQVATSARHRGEPIALTAYADVLVFDTHTRTVPSQQQSSPWQDHTRVISRSGLVGRTV